MPTEHSLQDLEADAGVVRTFGMCHSKANKLRPLKTKDDYKYWLKECESENSTGGEVLLYTKSDCEDCLQAKTILLDNGVRSRMIDLDKMPSYGEFKDETTTPQVLVGDTCIKGLKALKEAIADGSFVKVLDQEDIPHDFEYQDSDAKEETINEEAPGKSDPIRVGKKESFDKKFGKTSKLEAKQDKVRLVMQKYIQEGKLVVFTTSYDLNGVIAKGFLRREKVEFTLVEMDTFKYGNEMHKWLEKESGVTNLPIIYINGKYFGNHEKLKQSYDNCELVTLLEEA
jgi:glutaredoxin